MDDINTISIEQTLILELLDAANATCRSHLGKNTELYSLGALEATANFIYIIAAQQEGNTDLEAKCQEYAQYALKRLEHLSKE